MHQAFKMPFASIAIVSLILIIFFPPLLCSIIFWGSFCVVKMPQRPLTAGTSSLTEIINVSYLQVNRDKRAAIYIIINSPGYRNLLISSACNWQKGIGMRLEKSLRWRKAKTKYFTCKTQRFGFTLQAQFKPDFAPSLRALDSIPLCRGRNQHVCVMWRAT